MPSKPSGSTFAWRDARGRDAAVRTFPTSLLPRFTAKDARRKGGAPRRFGSSLSDADVSHDGKRIAYFTNDQDKVALKVALLDGTDAKVVRQFPVLLRHARPRWSPDDRLIAFQVGEWPNSDIYSMPAAGGEERAITTTHVSQGGFAWLPDGSGVVVSSTLGATVFYHATMNLWLAKLDGSAPRQLTFGENSYVDPDVGRNGRVVTSRLRVAYSIWKIPVNGAPADNVRSAERAKSSASEAVAPIRCS